MRSDDLSSTADVVTVDCSTTEIYTYTFPTVVVLHL